MICAVITDKTAEQTREILEQVEMAEIRLDRCCFGDEDIEEIFSNDTPAVATCRTVDGNWEESERKLLLAVRAGAHYADLEMEAPAGMSKRVARSCAEYGTILVRSYHNLTCTPPLDSLRTIADRLRHYGGEVVKIVTAAGTAEDVDRIKELYRYYAPASLIAFAVPQTVCGERPSAAGNDTLAALCRASRLDSLRSGAPFGYAAAPGCDIAAPGQIGYEDMQKAVYGGYSQWNLPLQRMPSSKSCAQRAIIASALAPGKSVISGYSSCGDSEAALALASALGAKTSRTAAADGSITLEIEGIDAASQCLPSGELHLGQSGLLARLMMPLGCQLFTGGVTLTGEGTLARRVLEGADGVVEALGGKVTRMRMGDSSAVSSGPLTLPLKVEGPLRPGRICVDGSHSSQIISGAMMALPLCARHTTLCVNHPSSIPYIYMTMDLLRKFGVKVSSEMYGGRALLDEQWDKCTRIVLKIRENQRYRPACLELDADWSAAAPLMVAGAVFGSVRLGGLDTTSLQADLSILDILLDAGAVVCQDDAPKGEILCRRAPLQPIDEDLTNCPDLFPCVALLCAFCQGRSNLDGVHRLVHKESNRAEAILSMLRGLGVRAEIKDDRMTIEGESLTSRLMNGRMLRGGKFSSFDDHRMVMALKVASLGMSRAAADATAASPVDFGIDNTDCVAKSWPQFNDIEFENPFKE